MDEEWVRDLATVIPASNLLTTDEEIRPYCYDAWPVTAQWRKQGKRPYGPQVVVRPGRPEAVCQLLAWASTHRVPITPWGAGSSVTGAPLAQAGITLDLSRLNRIVEVNEAALYVTVQAGKMGHELEGELNERGYTLNHSPQSLNRSTVGGWVATLASGQFSSRWGSIDDLVLALTVVLSDGSVVATKLAPRAAIGPDLKRFFLGSEGTLGAVVEVTLKIFPLAEHRIFESLRFPTVASGLAAMRRIMQAGLRPFLVRFYDEDEARHAMRDPHFHDCALFLGFEGIAAVAEAEYAASVLLCKEEGGEALGPEAAVAWMGRRFDFSTVESILAKPGGVAETIEVAHFWDRLLPLYTSLKQALEPHADEVLGHFSHVYPQGSSLYLILLGQTDDDAAAERTLMQIWQVSMTCCLAHGAALSHHHGIGLARLPFLRDELGPGLDLLERVKYALDPAGVMNPGKLGLVDHTA